MSNSEQNSMVYQWRANTVDMLTLRKVSMGKRDNRTVTSKKSDMQTERQKTTVQDRKRGY